MFNDTAHPTGTLADTAGLVECYGYCYTILDYTNTDLVINHTHTPISDAL